MLLLSLALVTIRANAKTFNLSNATVLEIQAAMAGGALTAERLTQLYLARIAAYDRAGPTLNTVLALNPRALETARALDVERQAKGPRSLLHGVPILIKDNYDTADLPTTGGSIALKGTVAPDDAFTVAKLRAAGAVVLAKTNLDEFARGGTGTSSLGGQTLNAYVPPRSPGGSSAGTAVGLAAGFAQAGTGSETGSSIRSPSSNNGIVGIAPSEGLVSRDGIIPISFTLDRAGPMARNVTDAALMLEIMAGMDPADLMTRGSLGKRPPQGYLSSLRTDALNGARVGLLRDLASPAAEFADCLSVFELAIADLKKAGASVIEISTGVDLHALLRDVNLRDAEYKASLNAYFATRGKTIPLSTLGELIATGSYLGRLRHSYARNNAVGPLDTNGEYFAKLQTRETVRQLMVKLIDEYAVDALVYPHHLRRIPTIAEAAPNRGETPTSGDAENARIGGSARLSTVTGFPTVIVPAGFTSDGIPLGIEFFGQLFTEPRLLALAFAYEQATHHRRLPRATPPLAGETFEYFAPPLARV